MRKCRVNCVIGVNQESMYSSFNPVSYHVLWTKKGILTSCFCQKFLNKMYQEAKKNEVWRIDWTGNKEEREDYHIDLRNGAHTSNLEINENFHWWTCIRQKQELEQQ